MRAAGSPKPPGRFAALGNRHYYLAGYTVTNLAAFTVIILIANQNGGSYDIRKYAGLGKKSPWLSIVLAFALISLIGLPPTAVFFGKIYLFETAVQSGLAWLAVIGTVNTLISAAYYLRPVKAMFIDSAEEEDDAPMPRPSNSVLATMGLVTAGVLVIGLHPGLLINAAEAAVAAIFS